MAVLKGDSDVQIYNEMKCPKCKCKEGYRVLYNGDKKMDYNTSIYRILCPKCNTHYLVKGDE